MVPVIFCSSLVGSGHDRSMLRNDKGCRAYLFLASTNSPISPVPLSICPPICLSNLFHYVPVIISSQNFPLTKCPSKRSRIVIPVCIHRWLWNDSQSLNWNTRGTLMFFLGHLSNFKDTQAEKSMIWVWFECFQMITPIWINRWLWNDTVT